MDNTLDQTHRLYQFSSPKDSAFKAMSQKDQFADLFSGVKKNDEKKMSLAERLRHQQRTGNLTNSSNLNSSWSGLDLLGSSLSSSQQKNNSTASSVSLQDDFDIFGISSNSSLNGNGKGTPNNTPLSMNGSTSTTPDILDDIFGATSKLSPLSKQTDSNLFEDDEFTDAFTEDSHPQEDDSPPATTTTNTSTIKTTTVPAPSESEMFKRDQAISELMEMGFELDVAKRALSETKNYDINEAISIIMNEAHKKAARSKPKKNTDPVFPEQDELTQAIQDLTVDIKSKAFNLLSKGRQTLLKGIELYKDQQFNNNDNQPAWMRNQSTYKQQSMKLEDDDDQGEEFDREKMRVIVERQRALDKQLKEEKERRAKLERRDSNNKFGEPVPRNRSKFDEPVSRRKTTRTSSQNSQHGVGAKFEEPVSRPKTNETSKSRSKFEEPISRMKRKEEPFVVDELASAPKPVVQSPAPSIPVQQEETFDIFNTPIPSSSGSNKPNLTRSLIPDVAISTFQLESFQDSRQKGNDFFKKGDFSSSLLKYQDSLSSLPLNHRLSIISFSNISNAQLKLGNSRECLNSINQALALIDSYGLKINQFNDVEIDDKKPLKPIWLKLVSRKAESLEHLEKFKEALDTYNLCIENGGATKSVLDGKRRVLKVLQPAPKQTPKPVSTPSRSSPSLQKPSENLKNLKTQNLQKEKEDLQKFELHDAIESKVSQWKQGKEGNLRALLASLHEILWPELGWKPVNMTDLVLNKKVKINYLKAVSKTHPDKLNNATVEQKMIAQNVFITLNQSWDKFKESNGMN